MLACVEPLVAQSTSVLPSHFDPSLRSNSPNMAPHSLRLGSIAPDFAADTTHGPVHFHAWLSDSWAILFSHPDDFTPVCTTELAEAARLAPEFARRSVKVIGLSANNVESHRKWIEDINQVGHTTVDFPIIGDSDRRVATLYDMLDALDPTNVDALGMPLTVRDVFVIDPLKRIRLKISYPASTGRNFAEILRVIDSLQLGDQYPVTTPVNWKKGDKVIIHPSVQGEEALKLFPAHETIRPYLRLAKDPST